MIKIGLDIATNTGIAVIEVDDETHEFKRVIMLDNRELYFKHDIYEQVKAIKELVCDVLSKLQISDNVVIALERSNYSKHCASIFGEICGMVAFEFISQLPVKPLIMQFSPDEWHKHLHAGKLERAEWKELSIKHARAITNLQINSDDEADAFNIAWYCHLCRNNVNIHEQVVQHRQTKRNIEHELVKLYQKRDYWGKKVNEYVKLISEQPNHQKALTTKMNKAGNKVSAIEKIIFELEQQRKGA